MRNLSQWAEKVTLGFLIASVLSFWLAFYLLWSGLFWAEKLIHFGRVTFSAPFWILGVMGFLMFVRSPFFSDSEKKFGIWFLWASFGVLFFWLFVLTDVTISSTQISLLREGAK